MTPPRHEISQGIIALLGRLCFSLFFILAGLHKVMHFDASVAALADHWFISLPQVAVIVAIVFELLGGTLVFFGFYTRYGAFLLFLFMVPVTLLIHAFWMLHNPMARAVDMGQFFKNIALIGGSLYIMALGAGKFSFDRLLNRQED